MKRKPFRFGAEFIDARHEIAQNIQTLAVADSFAANARRFERCRHLDSGHHGAVRIGNSSGERRAGRLLGQHRCLQRQKQHESGEGTR